MPALKHFHIYQRWGKKGYYRCTHSECSHYLHVSLLDGKKSTCPLCHKEMILTKDMLRRAVPRCIYCSNTKFKGIRYTAMDLALELFTQE